MQFARSLFRVALLTALTATVALSGCGSDGTSSDPMRVNSTGPVVRESASAPLPTASFSSATLSWSAPTENTDGSALTDLRGYKIYYGTSAGALTNTIPISGPGLQTYVIEQLAVGVPYYFAIATVATDGMESAQSAVVSKTVS